MKASSQLTPASAAFRLPMSRCSAIPPPIGNRPGANPLRRRRPSGRSRQLRGPLVILRKRQIFPRLGPVAAAAGALARLDAGKALIDIGDEAETPHLAVGDDIDTAIGLLANRFGDRARNAARKGVSVERLGALLGLDHLQQIERPRQTSDVGGK